MTNFATADRPLRSSYLSWVARCNMKAALDLIDDMPDEGGTAAQTGSVVHAGVAAFHLATGDQQAKVAAAFDAMRRCLPEFPLADADEARLFLTPYVADPRNAGATFAKSAAGSLAIEMPVTLQLPPHPLDSTRQLIHVTGTLDQLRIEDGRVIVCDLKTGAPTGVQMIHDYAYQIAAYTLAARMSGFPTAEPGYLIRAKRYRERTAELPSPSGVQWWMPYTAADCEMLLDQVRLNVALIRMGIVNFGPGIQCTYCPHKGLDGCIPKAKLKLGITLV